MPEWKGIVAKSFSPDEFVTYCNGLKWPSWRPSFIVLHNTEIPSLAQVPNGFSGKHMKGFVAYYRDEKKWSAGPHLFVDDRKIWVFTPLTTSGVHSPSWNSVALGLEMLGSYEVESFNSGRGKQVRNNAVAAMATLSAVLSFSPSTMRLHREDPLTTHLCPGKAVSKAAVIQQVNDLLAARHPGEHAASEPLPLDD